MKKLVSALSLTILIIAAALSGCSKGSEGAVLAKVNRSAITVSDFKKQLESLTPQMQQAVAADPKARKEFLEDLIGIELVIQEARKLGLDKEADFKKNMEARKKEVEEYKKKLEQQLQDAVKDELFNGMLKKELGDKMAKVVPPTDKEVKDYFAQNKDKINKAAGKQVSLKDIEQPLKMRMLQEKRRELYVAYSKDLKTKAKISVDDKALDTAMAELTKPKELDLSSMTVQTAPKKEGAK